MTFRASATRRFAAALRRSELVALTLADVERAPDGIVLHIGRSKTDQDGQGNQIAVPNGRRLKSVEARPTPPPPGGEAVFLLSG